MVHTSNTWSFDDKLVVFMDPLPSKSSNALTFHKVLLDIRQPLQRALSFKVENSDATHGLSNNLDNDGAQPWGPWLHATTQVSGCFRKGWTGNKDEQKKSSIDPTFGKNDREITKSSLVPVISNE
ncbi:conserved hypothetical protein [Ricinus communis]|uniref:Uncharacterized protein n=1 Tax=Ricinus communis TaxID=3988 RepID=B9RXA3_RICCO|nr:conserved hypothetical protein [Ricinus communis]